MTEHPEHEVAARRWTELVSALAKVAQGTSDWRGLAHTVAEMLGNPWLNWKELSRAKAQVHTDLANSDVSAPAASRLLEAVIALSVDEAGRKASADMLAACTRDLRPEDMLRRVRAILRNYVEFDVFSYSEYYREGDQQKNVWMVRGRFAMDGDDEFHWPARWIEIPLGLVQWVESPHRTISNLDVFYTENPEAETLRNHVVTQEYVRRGITSFVVVPRMDGGRVVAALTLGRRGSGKFKPFDETDQKYLDGFRLELVLRLVGEAFERQNSNLAQSIAGLFHTDAEPDALANKLVKKVGEGFGLEYVGLFRVNRARWKFEIVAEYDPKGNLRVPEDYKQDLDKGMLSHVLQQGRALYAPNVRSDPPPFNFIPGTSDQASAMCLPIRLRPEPDAEVEWIIDLESSQLDAFPPPEQASLTHLVQEVERSLQLWFEARLCTVLLDLVDQGVVVLGEGTRIERANKAARNLLGLKKEDSLPLPAEHKYSSLAAFGADRASREVIAAGDAPADRAYLRLLGPDGVERRALAGASYRENAFNRRIWLLGNVEHAAWVGSLRYMEMAVRTVTAQAHGRLLLASALLKQALAGMDANAPAYKNVDRALRSITSADIPYERIAWVHDVIAKPKRHEGILDVKAELVRFRDAVLAEKDGTLHLDMPDWPVVVKGDPERLSFALRSLLGHLLYVSLPDDQLKVCVTTNGGVAQIKVVLHRANFAAAPATSEEKEDPNAAIRDQIAYAERRAFSAAANGFDAVRAVIEAHGGELRQSTDSSEELRFTISRIELAAP